MRLVGVCLSDKENEIYRKKSRRIILVRNISFCLIVIGFGGFALLIEAGDWLPRYPAMFIGSWAIGAVGIGLSILNGFSRCPVCGKQYFWNWTFSNPFTRKCMHCGHRLGG